MSRRRLALGIGTIVVMGLLLLVYIVFHTPLRKPVWDALWDTCTMFCRPTRLGSVVFDGRSCERPSGMMGLVLNYTPACAINASTSAAGRRFGIAAGKRPTLSTPSPWRLNRS